MWRPPSPPSSAIRYAQQPPDRQHPYGHHKAEYMSSIIVGALIIVAGDTILHEAYQGFLAPQPIDGYRGQQHRDFGECGVELCPDP
jgi:Co/Zn/Cd efflux system component